MKKNYKKTNKVLSSKSNEEKKVIRYMSSEKVMIILLNLIT